MLRGAMAIAALALSAPAAAQLGAATTSPVPEGVTEGEGAANPKGHYAALDGLPDWGGIWFMAFGERPEPPKLKGEYLQRYEAWRAEVAANHGNVRRDRSNCSPPGLPRIMRLGQYPYEFLFTPGRVTINQEAWMQTRTIWTDGRALPEDPDPTFNGNSIGHWDGDALVVTSTGINDRLDMNPGMPHSSQFVLHERIYLSPDDPNVLVNEMRMEDPEALEEPYEVTVRYNRDRYGTLFEFQCAENDRNPVNEDGETQYN